jgi:hypothetical protein
MFKNIESVVSKIFNFVFRYRTRNLLAEFQELYFKNYFRT